MGLLSTKHFNVIDKYCWQKESILQARKPSYELKISAHYCSVRSQTSKGKTVEEEAWMASEVMSIVVDVNGVLNTNQDENIYERLKKAAQDGDIERLYELIAEDPNILLGHFDKVAFCETPLHIAAEKGQTHFAMELMTLKPSLALKLNASGFSPIHLALQSNHRRMVRGFITIDSNLVSIKGRGRITPLHHVARIAVHVAVKNHQIEAFKVLLGWLKRENREEILDWKDEDGNTAFHIAASVNQTEIMKLLRKTVKVKAMNLDGKTAMDILQTHQSPKASSVFRGAKERLLFGYPMTLAGYLSTKPSFIERRNNLLGLSNLNRTRHRSLHRSDSRSVILVVAILIVTATYQANLSPPGGFWQDQSSNPQDDDVGLPMWNILYGSTAALGIANFGSFNVTFPNTADFFGLITQIIFIWGYPVITGVIVCVPFVVFYLNKRRRRRVDFPARYFTSPHELS
ncbi:unnamed protein product [Arabis nemorensis]|uniref:PGG domain-containing protein n=1 Tax=Arabis nemorensis TaxID=586526 RepID=A0A565AVC9_9BRAS|nr:unnamed protein product [Arabis nemorensis]